MTLRQLLRGLTPEAFAWRWIVWRERRLGLDFIMPVEAEAAGLDSAVSARYASSGNRFLRRVLNRLQITPADSVVDLGCGKGGALRVLLSYPFARADGVELSDSLVEIARRNFSLLDIPPQRCRIDHADAGLFTALDSYSFFYLYAPFDCVTMRRVLGNIADSVARVPRRLTMVYYNPRCHEEVLAAGLFQLIEQGSDRWHNKIYVYQYDPKRQ